MKKYQIVSMMRDTTKTGKNLIRATLVVAGEGDPTETDNVAIWGQFPNFANIDVGSILEGELDIKQNGQYTNITLNAPRGAGSAVRRTKPDIEKAMEKKATNISEAQDKKADSIKIAANARDATLLTAQWIAQLTAQGTEWTKDDMKETWIEMRKWLATNYGDDEAPF